MTDEDIRPPDIENRVVNRASQVANAGRIGDSFAGLPPEPHGSEVSGTVRTRRLNAVGLGTALVLLVSFAAVYLIESAAPPAPSFRPVSTENIPQYKSLHYSRTQERPFEGGTVWLTLLGGSATYLTLLFDLETGAVLGELVAAGPEQFNADRTLLLCRQRTPAGSLPVSTRLRLWMEHAAHGAGSVWRMLGLTPPSWLRTSRPGASLDQEDYWILDMGTGEATYLGHIMEHSGVSSPFHRSQDLRFALMMPVEGSSPIGGTAYLVDMASQTMRRIRLEGWPIGWWDSTTALVWSKAKGLQMVDVMTGSHALLLTSTSVSVFMEQAELTLLTSDVGGFAVGGEASPFVSWNGREYDVYFTDGHRRWSAEESFLLKYDRVARELGVVSPGFKFEWSDHFDESMQNYLYSGRERGDRNDGVFLRNLNTGQDRTLVEPRGGHSFSIPRFYQDRVLYVRTNELWSVQLDGTDQKRVFPP